MAEVSDEFENHSQFVTFELDGETYCIDVMQIQEILRLTEITPVPGAPHFVLGIVNLRGIVVSVIDARQRMNLPPSEPTGAMRIIVVEIEKQIIGIMVDRVGEVIHIKDEDVESVPHISNKETSDYIRGIICHDTRLLTLLDIIKLLSAPGLAEISAAS